ncbi:YdcF family protein [Ramlibacter ginsenosidimutans]|uniref:YdcF family protein n=1 Tax=Ramlibacter ginsenosidimutans TaxID=502333 RepID=A0A934WMY3_9BURK|nr:YdcF family protein [Ramlibacter ginsenosidimutans]MBK6006662.1 YdcF family protein [Ramlibacter ginsenosidimutans]
MLGVLALVALASAWLRTTEAGARVMLAGLEWQSTPVDPQRVGEQAQAIAVLGGNLDRMDYGARLHQSTRVPLLVVGWGRPSARPARAARADPGTAYLLHKYGIAPRWVETQSTNTLENAVYSACLVSGMGVKRIALVTDPYHMPRASYLFRAAGFVVIPAPVPGGGPPRPRITLASFVPSQRGWDQARGPAHEWLGLVFGPVQRAIEGPRTCPSQDRRPSDKEGLRAGWMPPGSAG